MSSQITDPAGLAKYLEANIQGFRGPIELEQFSVGQSNPTFLVRAGSGEYVLRRQPAGPLLKSAHAVDREYRVLAALDETVVPTPKAFHLCRDRDIIGSMFFVMSHEPGRIFPRAVLPDLNRRERGALYSEMVRVLAAIHSLDPEAVGLGDFGRPGNYLERQVGRMSKQYRASETGNIPEMEKLMDWLASAVPADDGQASLVHGDYHFSNIIFQVHEPRIRAVLDWELSTLGHPIADLAYFCMGLRLPDRVPIPGLADVDRAELGIPEESRIVDEYCRARDIRRIDNWFFYLAFSFFRLASIVQGIIKRAEIGTASNRDAALKMGGVPAALALSAMELIEKAG